MCRYSLPHRLAIVGKLRSNYRQCTGRRCCLLWLFLSRLFRQPSLSLSILSLDILLNSKVRNFVENWGKSENHIFRINGFKKFEILDVVRFLKYIIISRFTFSGIEFQCQYKHSMSIIGFNFTLSAGKICRAIIFNKIVNA